MAFVFWGYVTRGGASAATDLLALVPLRGSSSIFSRLAYLGELVYLFEILLATTIAVLGAITVLRCFGSNGLCSGPAVVDEQCTRLNPERQGAVQQPSDWDPEVTIRLESGHLWPLRRHRCIVTVRTTVGSAQNGAREVWYATGEK
jgi:hypothetical protein